MKSKEFKVYNILKNLYNILKNFKEFIQHFEEFKVYNIVKSKEFKVYNISLDCEIYIQWFATEYTRFQASEVFWFK